MNLCYLMKLVDNQSCLEWIDKKTANQNYARVYVCSPEINFGLDEKNQQRWLSTSKTINEMIWQVLLSQKQMVVSTRSSRVFDDNGKTILQNKATSWNNFLNANVDYRKAFEELKVQKSRLVKEEVAALANLMLKLSISMGKNSLTVFNSMLLPEIINPTTLAVAFLQYLNNEILEKHNQNLTGQVLHHSRHIKSNQEALLDFYRQLPVITLINISRKRCKKDMQLLSRNYSNLIVAPEQRVQLIELFQEEEEGTEHHYYSSKFSLAINMKTHLGLSAPYGYELLMFFQEVLLNFMGNVSPNAILLVENYPSSVGAIKPEVYGLLINQLMTKVTDKIHISRQFGIYDSRFDKFDVRQEKQVDMNEEIYRAHRMDIQSSQQQMIMGMSEMDQYQFKLLAEFEEEGDQEKEKNKKKEKKYLADSTRCILQALSQRINFDLELEEEAQYDYPLEFLQNLRTIIIELDSEAKKGNYLKVHTEDEHKFRITHLEQMMILKQRKHAPEKWIDEVYSIPLKQRIRLFENGQFKWTRKDFTYIFYGEDSSMFIFIAQTNQYSLLRYGNEPQVIIFKRQYSPKQGELPKLWGFTAVASDKYLYIGFGRGQENQSAIYRLPLQGPKVWSCTTTAKLDQVNLQLENKVEGYGYYCRRNKMVLFMGGFNFLADNEERVNKYHYCVLQEDSGFVVVRGEKSSDHFFAKDKNHFQNCVIHTFVKGIVFPWRQDKIAILNTNGLRDDLNYRNRLYLTDMHISSIFKDCGILFQHKNAVDSKQTQLNRNEILRLMDCSSNYLNVYDSKAVLMDKEGRLWKLQFSQDQLNIDLEQMTLPRQRSFDENAMEDENDEYSRSRQASTRMEEQINGKKINLKFLPRPKTAVQYSSAYDHKPPNVPPKNSNSGKQVRTDQMKQGCTAKEPETKNEAEDKRSTVKIGRGSKASQSKAKQN